MSLLSDLIDGASGDSVPVSTLLRKVKVLASRAQIDQLAAWVEQELTGYAKEADLPDYRGPFTLNAIGAYGGPFGSLIQDAPIPSHPIRKIGLGRYFELRLTESIVEIESLAESKKELARPWSGDAIGIVNGAIERGEIKLIEMHGLMSARSVVSPNIMVAAVDAVRTRVLDLALELERSAPADVGEVGAEPVDALLAATVVTNIYGGSHNIAVASSGVKQRIELPGTGDQEALLDVLRSLGVDGNDLDDLREAIRAEDAGRAERVRNWLARYVLSPAGAIVLNGSGDLLAQVVGGFLGLGG
jgi:hypothetical protein